MPEWLKILMVQYICVYLVQSITYITALYAFSKKKIDIKKFILASVLFMLGTVLIRMLPIHFGVHTLLSLLLLMLIGCTVLKLDITLTVKSTLISTIILIVFETLNLIVLRQIYGNEWLNTLEENSLTKNISGLPANFAFLIAIVISYIFIQRHIKKKAVAGAEEKETAADKNGAGS